MIGDKHKKTEENYLKQIQMNLMMKMYTETKSECSKLMMTMMNDRESIDDNSTQLFVCCDISTKCNKKTKLRLVALTCCNIIEFIHLSFFLLTHSSISYRIPPRICVLFCKHFNFKAQQMNDANTFQSSPHLCRNTQIP